MQRLLLEAKREGATSFPGIGFLRWPDVLALCDVLLSAVWTLMTVTDSGKLRRYIAQDRRMQVPDPCHFSLDRFDSLMLLAWLFDDWPRHITSNSTLQLSYLGIALGQGPVPWGIGLYRGELRGSRISEVFASAGAG